MKHEIRDFFNKKNSVQQLSIDELNQINDYLAPIKALARVTYKSFYVIDYEKKEFDFVSENPLFLCGNTSDELKEMGYSFYLNYVLEEDLELLFKINTIGFEFYESLPTEERIDYSASYDFHLKDNEGKIFLVNQKITPIYLTDEGKIWKAICVVSLSSNNKSGNIRVFKDHSNKQFVYDLENNFWKKETKHTLTNREQEILQHSIKGLKVSDIANLMFVSVDTIKFHKKKIFEKLEVSNITEAIFYATDNKII